MVPGANSGNWQTAARKRFVVLLAVVLVPTLMAVSHLAAALPQRGGVLLEILLVLSFGTLFAWILFGFWTAAAGFGVLVRRFDRFHLRSQPMAQDLGISENELPDPREIDLPPTAVVMPIYNEDIDRIAASLEVMIRSLEATGRLRNFDVYILSDSDQTDRWIAEEAAWAGLCARVDGFGRIFYRNRRPNLKRKSGNVADFCRRWGHAYRYMIVLDADSLMSGPTLVNMVRMMERHPDIGILQTAPALINRETLLARLQQFANHIMGPLLAAGLHYWQLGAANYWGHNAIIRVAPFMRHCGLPKLPGRPPLGGEILSHDFVESALMRRAGWSVWLAYDLQGSYEETPPTLMDELQRDRRWCQGNLQHLRLLFTSGFFPTHRAVFLAGALSYASSLLWLAFISLSMILAVWLSVRSPDYFPAHRTLFPQWPVFKWHWSLALVTATGVILFLPKLLAALWVCLGNRGAGQFGGPFRLMLSLLIETVMSTLLAPVRMLFHSKFVFLTVLGRPIGWTCQARDDRGTSFRQALSLHGPHALMALAVGAFLAWSTPMFFWWVSPVLVSLLLAPLVSVWTSRPGAGLWFKKRGLLLTSEELDPPPELRGLRALLASRTSGGASPASPGFVQAVVDPAMHSLHLALLRRPRGLKRRIALRRAGLCTRALRRGPQTLSEQEKRELLQDPSSLVMMHHAVWRLTDARARGWGLPSL